MSELAIRSAIIQALRKEGAWVVVTTGVSHVGCPDLLVCYQGRFVALEVKAKDGRATSMQRYTLQGIEKAGGTAAIVRSVEEALRCVAEHLG